jgi:hypothetical protein
MSCSLFYDVCQLEPVGSGSGEKDTVVDGAEVCIAIEEAGSVKARFIIKCKCNATCQT